MNQNQSNQSDINKYCEIVYYKDEIWYCAECIRATLLKELKRTTPDYLLKIYNKHRNVYDNVQLKDLSI